MIKSILIYIINIKIFIINVKKKKDLFVGVIDLEDSWRQWNKFEGRGIEMSTTVASIHYNNNYKSSI